MLNSHEKNTDKAGFENEEITNAKSLSCFYSPSDLTPSQRKIPNRKFEFLIYIYIYIYIWFPGKLELLEETLKIVKFIISFRSFHGHLVMSAWWVLIIDIASPCISFIFFIMRTMYLINLVCQINFFRRQSKGFRLIKNTMTIQ